MGYVLSAILMLFAAVTRFFVYALDVFLIIRAVMSWFPDVSESRFGDFIYCVTEPLAGFVRNILYKFPIFRDSPIDFSVFFSCMFLGFLLMFL